MRLCAPTIVLFLAASVAPTFGATLTLYDATEQAVTPDAFSSQLLIYGATAGTQTYSGADTATNLDTTVSNAAQAGYATNISNPQSPELNRLEGYTFSFTIDLLAEAHSSADRAGFSVIAVSSDSGVGVLSSIEIAFQDSLIFAQSDAFTAAESVAFDMIGSGFVAFDLVISGAGYELFADSSSILSGSLRDYALYRTIPNVVYLGDNTTSAQGDVNLRRVALTTADVPEPSTWLLLSLGLFALAGRARRRSDED